MSLYSFPFQWLHESNEIKRDRERKKKEASFHDVAGVAGFFLLLRFHFNIFPHRLSTPISLPFIFCIFSRRLCVCVCFSHSAGISEIPSELTVSATDDLTPLPPPPSPGLSPRHRGSVPVARSQPPRPPGRHRPTAGLNRNRNISDRLSLRFITQTKNSKNQFNNNDNNYRAPPTEK